MRPCLQMSEACLNATADADLLGLGVRISSYLTVGSGGACACACACARLHRSLPSPPILAPPLLCFPPSPQSLSAIANLKLDADDAPGNAWMAAFTAVPITA